MHDLLFQYSTRLDDKMIVRLGESLGLNKTRFAGCMDESTTIEAVNRDIAEATGLGIFEVPTFLIGTRRSDGAIQVSSRLAGSVSFDRLRSLIEKLPGASASR